MPPADPASAPFSPHGLGLGVQRAAPRVGARIPFRPTEPEAWTCPHRPSQVHELRRSPRASHPHTERQGPVEQLPADTSLVR